MKLTPLKAIRRKCLDCSVGSRAEVRECVIPGCPLYLYRLGKNPARKGMGSIQNLQDSQKLSTQLGVLDGKKMKRIKHHPVKTDSRGKVSGKNRIISDTRTKSE